MRSGSGWTNVFEVTVKAKNVIAKNSSDTEIIPQIPLIELDTANYPPQTPAVSLEYLDGTPANGNDKNVSELKTAMLHAIIRGNYVSKNPDSEYDEKVRHYNMHENGMSWIQIAKSNLSKLAEEFGEKRSAHKVGI